ncbi:hypothetical protein Pla52o_34170 [Novipirellula galeiformis]|uniref:Uncharacterized protein n=1 Tax=Novipirellula galeiformis TaxID=2528004 RepID=A0A5C6CGF3_9BACT|nr:hypothetical protein Pla52o_34170 [Novipirellula galeiformis]
MLYDRLLPTQQRVRQQAETARCGKHQNATTSVVVCVCHSGDTADGGDNANGDRSEYGAPNQFGSRFVWLILR